MNIFTQTQILKTIKFPGGDDNDMDGGGGSGGSDGGDK